MALLMALGTIQIINLCSIKVRNFVYGTKIRTSTINVSKTFFASGQYKVSDSNFARLLLMLFIIWCLIIRTCYQSELFNYLQAEKRKAEAKTIAELIEKNFSFYCVNYGSKFLLQIVQEQKVSMLEFLIKKIKVITLFE